MSDWNKVLNLRLLGTVEEERQYANKLKKFNVAYEGDVFTTPFYPHLKSELVQSWQKLFNMTLKSKKQECCLLRIFKGDYGKSAVAG